MLTSVQMIYDHLQQLVEGVDVATAALYRQEAQEVLADPGVSLSWRQAIADRLNQANRLLGLSNANNNDSY